MVPLAPAAADAGAAHDASAGTVAHRVAEPVTAEPMTAEPMTAEPMTAEPMTADDGEAAGEPPTTAAHPAAEVAERLERTEELEERIVVLAAHLHAGEHELLTLVGEFDRLRGWERAGHRTCAHWLAFRTGIDLGACREKVRAARALTCLPLTSASMQRGELSFSQVRALTRVATADNEADLLELARGATAAQLERMVRGYRLASREEETDRERLRHESREFSAFHDEDGMVVVRGRLTPEVGALLMRALEAAGDALYRERRSVGRVSAETSGVATASMPANAPANAPESMPVKVPANVVANVPDNRSVREEASEREAAARRADALGLLAERALAAGFGGVSGAGEGKAGTPVSGTRAERYQVLLHVDADTLAEERGGLGRSELEDGTRVSAETSRRLSCDASVVEIAHARDGSVLDVGRRRRTIPPALRRALEVRDRGCRFPGCGLRFTDAHHLRHWADGGETRLGNLLLLCAHHHRLVHEQGWRVEWWGRGADRAPAFLDPRGQTHVGRPPPPTLAAHPVANLVARTRARGAHPDAHTAGARWKRERDIPDDVYFNALEAIG